jgi:hypothetical protein
MSQPAELTIPMDDALVATLASKIRILSVETFNDLVLGLAGRGKKFAAQIARDVVDKEPCLTRALQEAEIGGHVGTVG